MSAIDAHDPNAVLVFIDGFNNEGFSGWPVIYWNFTKHRYSLLAVIKGYNNESAKVRLNRQDVKTQLLVNSGILLGYSTAYIKEAIESDSEKTKNN